MTTEVVLVSATWCARCKIIKPDVEALCKTTGATFTVVDYDDLEEDDPVKQAVKALPTIRMRCGDGAWSTYVPAELDAWKNAMISAAAVPTSGEDF
jgi:thiol-disulfide isomerase/thioredoxin